MRHAVAALALAAVAAAPPPALGDTAPGLSVDTTLTGSIAAGSLVLLGATGLFKSELAPPTCRWCEPPSLDRNLRSAVLWSDTGAADSLSNVLVVVMPLSLAGTDYLLSGRDARRTGEDVLVVVESVAVAGVFTQAMKYIVGRRRPYAWAAGGRTSPDDDLSFPSGHTTIAFAAAGAFGSVARLRGYAGWPWVYAGGALAATSIAYLRMAGDQHWFTDVAAAAALSSAIGVAMPLLFHRGGDDAAPALTVTPFPLGVSGRF